MGKGFWVSPAGPDDPIYKEEWTVYTPMWARTSTLWTQPSAQNREWDDIIPMCQDDHDDFKHALRHYRDRLTDAQARGLRLCIQMWVAGEPVDNKLVYRARRATADFPIDQ